MKSPKFWSLVLVLAVAYFTGAYWGDFGFQQKLSDLWEEQTADIDDNTVPTGADKDKKAEPVPDEPEVDEVFLMEVLSTVLEKFWRPDQIESDKLTYGAVGGMIDGLSDAHSNFYSPEEADDFLIAVDGELSGIGAEIGYDDDGNIIIITPLPGSPAEVAGILPWDRILAVDGVSTAGFSLDDAVKIIRGEKGTQVTLSILHPEAAIPEDIMIVRDQIFLDSLVADVREDGVLDVRIIQFDEDTPRELSQRIDQSIASGAIITGVLLDLRGNVGGYFEGAIAVAGEFLDPGTVVVIEKAKEKETKSVARGLSRLKGLPTVILVDAQTASAAEILAGALHDLALVTLVGQKTYGKVTVQEIIEFPDGSALKVTVAEWLLPSGGQVEGLGIEPD